MNDKVEKKGLVFFIHLKVFFYSLKDHAIYVKNNNCKNPPFLFIGSGKGHNFNFDSDAIINKCITDLDLDFSEAVYVNKMKKVLG